MTDTPKLRRRWFQFSLRTLLLLIAVASLVFGGFAHKMRQLQQQRDIVRIINASSGEVTYDYEVGQERYSTRQPPGPEWLRKHLGEDTFANVVEVCFEPAPDVQRPIHYPGSKPFTDDSLLRLQVLPQLDVLNLFCTDVTDAGLTHLAGFKKLKRLSLAHTAVTNSGLVHVQKLTQLEFLSLDGIPVTDSGLANLNGLTQLEMISLNRTQITDSGLAQLRDLTGPKFLRLCGIQITDAGLVHLQGLSRLETLWLTGSGITDKGCKELQKALPKLKIEL